MKYYYLGENDQPQQSWVLFDVNRETARNRNAELPIAIYKFLLPFAGSGRQIKPEYMSVCCKTCGRYTDDDVFNIGFRDPSSIRVTGDFTHTSDRILIFNERIIKALREANIGGFETKPVGSSGWHAVRVTERVGFAENVMELIEPFCPECKRARTTRGMIESVSQLQLPAAENTLFTTLIGWPTMLWDRWVFLTEGVVNALKNAGIKGGYCNRLLTPDEAEEAKREEREGRFWRPKGYSVKL